MSDRFEKFTERARKVLTLAQEEAQRFGHNYIGTEHLLLGLIREEDGVAACVLNKLGVELQKVRSAVEFIVGRNERGTMGAITMTSGGKNVIEYAVDEARRMNHHYIGTEHILLGLTREKEGIATGVLDSLNVSLDRIRQQVIQVIERSTQPTTSSGSQPTKNFTYDILANADERYLSLLDGRDEEIEEIVKYLTRRTKNNPVLLAEPGIEVDLLILELARRINHGNIPAKLASRPVIGLNTNALLLDGTVEDFTRLLTQTANSNGILVIPFIDQLLDPNLPYFQRNLYKFTREGVQVIGITTHANYHDKIKNNPTLIIKFPTVSVRGFTDELTLKYLQVMTPELEAHHGVKYAKEALDAAISLSNRYRFGATPEDILTVLDDAGSLSQIAHANIDTRPNLRQLMLRLEITRQQKEAAISTQQFKTAENLRTQERHLRDQIARQQAEERGEIKVERPIIGEREVAAVFAREKRTTVEEILKPELTEEEALEHDLKILRDIEEEDDFI
jgi:ATP-dependent Clp protease ATP-binding subunit ClpC